MSGFYVRVSPVGYLQPDGTLGFGSTAAVFESKASALRAWNIALAPTIIHGVHAEVAPTTPIEKAPPAKKKGKRK